eukprot:CAMPEP_0114270394 /NCGR_PEP_ID=MMETSP0058-20121206/27215_1 /TAXON_ID=36894 /ORGANISM="Pyramimonas parkeae, CCMP726" /LENGTH=72 /DNA_ID=CAMNT_0001389129 /DNA_START=19 /DNA_END=234 /DNA_ORIENTATION=+
MLGGNSKAIRKFFVEHWEAKPVLIRARDRSAADLEAWTKHYAGLLSYQQVDTILRQNISAVNLGDRRQPLEY